MTDAIGFNRLIRYCFNSFSSIVVSKLLICNVTHCFELLSNGGLPLELPLVDIAFEMLPLKPLLAVWPLLELKRIQILSTTILASIESGIYIFLMNIEYQKYLEFDFDFDSAG